MAKGKIEWGRMLGKLSPYTILKGLRYMKHYGPKEFWIRLHERFEPEEVPYGPWYEEYKVKPEELEKQKKKKWNYEPKISVVVPAYKTPEKFLREMIDSLLAQSYVNWELCIANASPDEAGMSQILEEYCKKDARICVKPLLNNAGIAENTNEALEMATGDFIGLLDHDDLLAPNALYEVAKALESHPKTDVIYTDEDKVRADLSEHFQPNLKPDFNLDLLRSNNYICHFFVVRRTIVETIRWIQERNMTEHRIMILFSAVVKARKRFIMCRKSYITGERIRHRQQTIRQVRCMRLKPENVQLKVI